MLSLLFLNNTLIRVTISKEELKEARVLSKERGIPFTDCLFAVLARNHNATLVTNDRHFFCDLSDITKAVRP